MAESVITFLLSNVNALLLHEAKIFLGVDEQIRSVCHQLEWIRSFLKDADMKRHKYERVNVWVNQIRDVAYDAEDTIDTYVLKLQLHLQRNLALRFICIPKKLNTIHALGVQLKVIKARLDDISDNKNRYGLEHIQPGESSFSTDVAPKEKRAPIVEEADVVGFEEDAEKLAKALLVGEESPRRSVVSIVGMGGLGKTTLAKYVYRRRGVKDGFQVRAWVYVSQEYVVKDLLLSIMKQVSTSRGLTREQEMEMDEEALKNKLLENLSGKRYLIFVDDIWVKEAWELIEKAFPNDKNGSWIMLTTRKREVALFADPSRSPHDLHLLDKDESWKLFCKKAFPASSCPTELTQLGEQIVAKAGGLPLAIVVLGGLLSTKQKSHSLWQKVLESANWYLSEGSDQCSQVLTLSYNDLPYYLKSCFLYFGMYPEDVEIEAGNLIRLWVAEGFIQERGNEIMEDVAEDYLEELIHRSMVQVARRGDDGSVEACRIHDLLRDLAIREAKQDRFLEVYGSCGSIEACRPRRLTAHPGERNTNPQYGVENIRSLLLCFRGGLEDGIWRSSYGGVKLLRVLDLSNVYLKKLPKEIGGLILLKYLKLGGIKSNKLPDSISNLISLQTLDLSRTRDLQVTPNMFRNLQQLRHLFCPLVLYSGTSRECDRCSNPFISNQVDNLRDLQTLETKAGKWMNGSGLEKLTNLRHLGIEGELEWYSKVLSDSLANFHRLRSLYLCQYSQKMPLPLVSFSHNMHLTHLKLWGPLEKLPNNEDFPPNLAFLRLRLSKLKESVDPMAILENLPNLRALIIENAYLGKKMTCSRGGFVNLHRLEIEYLPYLEEWIVEEGAMPNLKRLEMWNCPQLKVISDSIKHITALKEVEFERVPPKITSWWRQPSSSHHGSSSGGDGGANIDVKVT